MEQYPFIQQGTTTLGSLYSKHGRIADATYEWYNGYPEKSNFKYARKIYREIVTKDFLANIKEYKGEEDRENLQPDLLSTVKTTLVMALSLSTCSGEK